MLGRADDVGSLGVVLDQVDVADEILSPVLASGAVDSASNRFRLAWARQPERVRLPVLVTSL